MIAKMLAENGITTTVLCTAAYGVNATLLYRFTVV